MEKELTSTQVRDRFSTILDEVQYQGGKYIVKRKGKPAAAIVPLHIYQNWKKNQERLFELISQAQEASGESDPEEMMALALEAQTAVRTELG
jgi:prevent-host-death family protein